MGPGAIGGGLFVLFRVCVCGCLVARAVSLSLGEKQKRCSVPAGPPAPNGQATGYRGRRLTTQKRLRQDIRPLPLLGPGETPEGRLASKVNGFRPMPAPAVFRATAPARIQGFLLGRKASLWILGFGVPSRRNPLSGPLKSTLPGPREGSSILNVDLVVVTASVVS